MYNTLRDKTDADDTAGEAIVIFAETLFVTPRGRYDIEMSNDFFRLRGKTYDYKVAYSSVVRLYVLPKADEVNMFFIVGLDPPMRQGQTRYPFLIMQFAKEEDMEVELNLEDEVYNTTYKDRLQRSYDQPAFQVVSQIFRGLTQKKVTTPSTFKGYVLF